jgi:hypothetical protein
VGEGRVKKLGEDAEKGNCKRRRTRKRRRRKEI